MSIQYNKQEIIILDNSCLTDSDTKLNFNLIFTN